MKSRIRQKATLSFVPATLMAGRAGSFFFIVLSSLLLMLAVVRPDAIVGVRTHTTDLVAPVLSAFSRPFQNLAEAIGGVSGAAALRAENAQLKAENVRLKEWYQTALMLQAENKSLQELLSLKVSTNGKYITARVISDAGNSFVKTILVASGKNEGIQKNQAVLSGEGMLGRVIEAGDTASRILLLTDINSRVPVLVEGSSQKAILAGSNEPYLTLKHLPQDGSLSEGARIVTSGHGGLFPSGLPVGRVVRNDAGQFVVKPFANMSRVTYVRVLESSLDNHLIQGNLGTVSD